MHQLRRDCRPSDPGKSSLEKIILAVCTRSIQRNENDEILMRTGVLCSGNAGLPKASYLILLLKRKTLQGGKQAERSLQGV